MALPAPTIKLNTGVEMPMFGLGTWKSKEGEVYEAVKTAIESGYRLIDCAYAYRNEHEVGRALKDVMGSGVVKREELFIVTKLWNTFHSKEAVPKGIAESLRDLGLDYVDLYLIHWPFGYQEGGDPFPYDKDGKQLTTDVDYVETWKAMEEVYKSGKAKAIGISNFNSQQINRLLENASVVPAVNQVELHPYLTQEKLVEFCRSKGIQVMGYSPLGSPDRPWAKAGDPSLLEDPKIKAIADKYGKSPAHVLIRYQLDRGIIVIPKSVTPSRIKSNAEVFDFKLSAEDIATINSFNRNHRFCDMNWVKHHQHWPFNIEY